MLVCWWTTFLSYSQISFLGHSSKMECYDWCVWTCQFWDLETFDNYFPKCSLKVFRKPVYDLQWILASTFLKCIVHLIKESIFLSESFIRTVVTIQVMYVSYLLTVHALQYLRNHIFHMELPAYGKQLTCM